MRWPVPRRGRPEGPQEPSPGETPGLGLPAPLSCTLSGCRKGFPAALQAAGFGRCATDPGFHPGLGSCGPSGRRGSAVVVCNPSVKRSRIQLQGKCGVLGFQGFFPSLLAYVSGRMIVLPRKSWFFAPLLSQPQYRHERQARRNPRTRDARKAPVAPVARNPPPPRPQGVRRRLRRRPVSSGRSSSSSCPSSPGWAGAWHTSPSSGRDAPIHPAATGWTSRAASPTARIDAGAAGARIPSIMRRRRTGGAGEIDRPCTPPRPSGHGCMYAPDPPTRPGPTAEPWSTLGRSPGTPTRGRR
jgi:hypothetical protein